MAVGNERRDRETLPGGIPRGMRKIIVRTYEIRDLLLLPQHADYRSYSNCAVRKSLQH